MKIIVKTMDQTEIVAYEADVIPREGEYVAMPPDGQRAIVEYVVHHPFGASVELYVEPITRKGSIVPSTPEELDPYPLTKPNGAYDR